MKDLTFVTLGVVSLSVGVTAAEESELLPADGSWKGARGLLFELNLGCKCTMLSLECGARHLGFLSIPGILARDSSVTLLLRFNPHGIA